MHKIITFFSKSWIPWVLLIGIAIISHLEWFNPISVLTHGDWSYWNLDASRELNRSWSTWLSFNSLGSFNIQVTFYAFNIFWSLLAHVGIGYEFAPKLTLMIPVAILGFIAPYAFILRLFKDRWIAFLCALFYGSTTYFLVRQTGHIPIALVYALAPLLFLFMDRAFQTKKFTHWMQFALIYWIASFVEIRITYILTFLLLIYLLLFHLKAFKQNLRNILFTGLIIVGLSAFWALPTILGGAASNIQSVANRGLFGNHLFDIEHAIALADSAWTGGMPNELFISQPVKWFLWLIPLLALTGAILTLKSSSALRRKQAIFFIGVALAGIFFTKQSGTPLPGSYELLYQNFPGFNLFREASKFYIMTAFGYLGLIGLALMALKEPKATHSYKRIALILPGAALTIVSIINLWPFINQSARTLFVAFSMPPVYQQLEEELQQQSSYFRTLWVPSASRWGYFSTLHPKLDEISLVQSSWKDVTGNVIGLSPRSQIEQFFGQPLAQKTLQDSVVKYVVVPLRDQKNDDDTFKYYGDDRQYFVDVLNSVDWLRKTQTDKKELDIFEVDGSRPYISSSSEVFNFGSGNANSMYNFASSQLSDSPDFLGEDSRRQNASSVYNLLENVDSGDIKKGKIVRNFEMKGSPEVYIGNSSSYSYSINDQRVSFAQKPAPEIKLGETNYSQSSKTSQNLSAPYSSDKEYYLSVSGGLHALKRDGNEHDLGVIQGPVSIVSTRPSSNLIKNPSLEEGLWTSRVEDCNNYDADRRIGMKLQTSNAMVGKTSLRLWAERHAACTGPNPMQVAPGALYHFSFGVKTRGISEAAYEIQFNDPSRTTKKEYITSRSGAWQRVNRVITTPVGATSATIRLIGLPNTDHWLRADTDFDDLQFAPLTTELQSAPTATEKHNRIDLPDARQLKFEIMDPSVDGRNLIPNPSFEQGTWQKQVGDCNAVDDNPKLKMELSKDKRSDGMQSLELGAANHAACTGPDAIEVGENASYAFMFDYQGTLGGEAGYHMSFDDPARTILSEKIPINKKDWEQLKRVIKTPIGASKVNITVYGFSKDHVKKTFYARYDDFKLIKITSDVGQYHLVDKIDSNVKPPASIKHSTLSSTKKAVQIKGATTPFYVAMSEEFNTKWRLEMNNSKVQGLAPWLPGAKVDAVAESDHFRLNNFQNGWYVDVNKLCREQNLCVKNADGSYDLEMVAEFTPQRWFYVGLIISGATLLGCLVYLGLSWRRSRRS